MVKGKVVPNGGWGWVVVFASFTMQALTIGITYTFGILFVALLDEFEAGQSTTSWIGSIQPALLYFTGIVAGPLIQKFGWRTVAVSGSVLSSIGFFASSFSPNVYLLYFTYGGLTGIGNGMMYVTSMVAVQHYFDTRRAMATGVAVSGSGVGTLTFGYLTQKLLDTVGWRNTLRIQAGIILIGVICGILYRPLPETGDEEDDETDTDGAYTTDERLSLTKTSTDDEKCSEDSSVSIEEAKIGCFTKVFDLSLFKNPVFVLFCVSIILFCFGYHVPFTYTPERAIEMGVEPASASFLVSIIGIANVASRLIFGWVGDRSPHIRFYLGGTVLTLGGVVSCMISLFNTHELMIVYSVLFGAFTGCWASLFPVILVDLLGVDAIEKSLGQALAAGSIAFLLASPMSGWIIQETNSFDTPYQVVGTLEAVGGFIFFCILCIKKPGPSKPDYEEIEGGKRRSRRRRRYVSESFS